MKRQTRITALAVTDSTRMPFLPDVPSVVEAGYPDAEGVALWSVFAPSNMSDSSVEKLRAGITQAVKSPDFQKVLEQRLMLERLTTSQELVDLIRKEEVRFKKAVKILDLKMQ